MSLETLDLPQLPAEFAGTGPGMVPRGRTSRRVGGESRSESHTSGHVYRRQREVSSGGRAMSFPGLQRSGQRGLRSAPIDEVAGARRRHAVESKKTQMPTPRRDCGAHQAMLYRDSFFLKPDSLSLRFVKYFFLVDWLDQVVFVNCQLGGFKAVWIWG